MSDIAKQLRELARLVEESLISREEYAELKKVYLAEALDRGQQPRVPGFIAQLQEFNGLVRDGLLTAEEFTE